MWKADVSRKTSGHRNKEKNGRRGAEIPQRKSKRRSLKHPGACGMQALSEQTSSGGESLWALRSTHLARGTVSFMGQSYLTNSLLSADQFDLNIY